MRKSSCYTMHEPEKKKRGKVYTQYNAMVQIIIGLLIRHYAGGKVVAAAGVVARFSEVDREVVKCKCS